MEITCLLNHLNQICPLNNKLMYSLETSVKLDVYKRNEVIQSPSNPGRMIWFVQTGFLYRYYYYKDRKIFNLYKKHALIVNCFPGVHTDHYLQVLDDCELIGLDSNTLSELKQNHPEIGVLKEKILLREITHLTQAARIARASAEERYVALLHEFPELFSLASQEIITSYLNISRDTLARLRKKY